MSRLAGSPGYFFSSARPLIAFAGGLYDSRLEQVPGSCALNLTVDVRALAVDIGDCQRHSPSRGFVFRKSRLTHDVKKAIDVPGAREAGVLKKRGAQAPRKVASKTHERCKRGLIVTFRSRLQRSCR